MKEREIMYVRLTKTLNDPGTLVPSSQDISTIIKDFNTDYYSSLYYYNEEQKKYASEVVEKEGKSGKYKGPRGVAGIFNVITDKLFFDFDSKDLDEAKKDTVELISRLKDYGIPNECVDIAFSGSKGFSIIVQHDQHLTPNESKIIGKEIAKGLKSFDPKIYNASRVFRVIGTKHPDTGLYKTQLTHEELTTMSISEIKEIATKPYLPNPIKKAKLSDEIIKMKYFKQKSEPTISNSSEISDSDVFDLDLSQKPRWLSNWKFALSRGFFKEGMRNSALLILAATCKANSFSKSQTYYFLKSAADEQSQRFNCDKYGKEEIWKNIVEQVYGEMWNGGTYSEDNFPDDIKDYYASLNISRSNEEIAEVSSMIDISSGFLEYITSFENNSLKFNLKKLDKDFPIPSGTNVGLIGAASSGKTAVALKLLSNASKSGMVCVFASLDMSRSRMFEKMLYKVTGGAPREEVFKKWKNKEDREHLKTLILNEFGNVYMFNKSAATVQQIRSYLNNVEERTGKKVDLLMVDYFERVMSDFSDDTKASKMVANDLQDIVNDMPNIRVITLVQPAKYALGGGPDNPILSYTAIKGSSFLYQSFRQILSIWRPFFTPQTQENDNYMQMAILKNDLGELGTYEFGWNGRKGEIYELGDIERKELKDLLDAKQNTGSARNDDF